MFLFYLSFTRNKDVIIGAAPYHISIYFLLLIKFNHNVIYYSSWPYWDLSRYPRKIYLKNQLKAWRIFLSNINAVAVTEEVKKGLQQYTNNITVIPHCINPECFNITDRLKREENKLNILYVGRLIPEKGIRIILDLANRYKVYNGMQINWNIIGEGELRDEVINQSLGNSNIKYFGQFSNQNELAKMYKMNDILILPSQINNPKWEELFGIVLIEAMACGCVPIASRSVGPSMIISHNVDGILIEPVDDSEAYIIELKKLIVNPELIELFAERSFQKTKSIYTDEINAELWLKVINRESSMGLFLNKVM
ncbi:Glycosyltransferase involved in cell wall bisynthesis [Paenibacillus sp. RU4T]|nr:Glycosyltransferase involved in cell wall bisynthesis [Paenibacillus sp. RU4X]SIR64913.1 Glycosyltransferase involved in cell wall bisynthesis [Paenibacillus sp. RU4T]